MGTSTPPRLPLLLRASAMAESLRRRVRRDVKPGALTRLRRRVWGTTKKEDENWTLVKDLHPGTCFDYGVGSQTVYYKLEGLTESAKPGIQYVQSIIHSSVDVLNLESSRRVLLPANKRVRVLGRIKEIKIGDTSKHLPRRSPE